MKLFSKKPRNSAITTPAQIQPAFESPLPTKDWPQNDNALLEFQPPGTGKDPQNFWSLNDAFEGVSVFGGTGSGKSSGSGRALARAFLEANMGGLVLTSKKDELQNWLGYIEESGRPESDVLIFSSRHDLRFNFLRYELARDGDGAGETENLVNLFCSVLEVAERRGSQSGSNDNYWQRTLKQLLRNAIDLAVIASEGQDLDLPALYQIISTAPQSLDQTLDDSENGWQQTSACFALLGAAEEAAEKMGRETDFELTRNYWLQDFPTLAHETRSIIVSIFTSMADCFLRGTLRELFCGDLNVTPEDTFDGKILILDLPIKEFQDLGQFAQVLFKFIWQRAVERRIPPNLSREEAEATIRPVFLWADEAQFFANSYDAQFQGTARSSRACTVYLTQSLPSYFSAFGGPNARYDAETFLGNLQTKIWHANGDSTTNNWAADTIGKNQQIRINSGLSEGYLREASNQRVNQSAGASTVIDYAVQPREFTMMRSGGPENEFTVDSVAFQSGRTWRNNARNGSEPANFIHCPFNQKG